MWAESVALPVIRAVPLVASKVYDPENAEPLMVVVWACARGHAADSTRAAIMTPAVHPAPCTLAAVPAMIQRGEPPDAPAGQGGAQNATTLVTVFVLMVPILSPSIPERSPCAAAGYALRGR